MALVTRGSEIQKNLRVLQAYLAGGNSTDSNFAKSLVQRGICFFVVRYRGKDFFAPSRFIGYVANSRRGHLSRMMDGRETNRAIRNIIGSPPKPSRSLEHAYRTFCERLGVTPWSAGTFGVTRKFWDVRP